VNAKADKLSSAGCFPVFLFFEKRGKNLISLAGQKKKEKK